MAIWSLVIDSPPPSLSAEPFPPRGRNDTTSSEGQQAARPTHGSGQRLVKAHSTDENGFTSLLIGLQVTRPLMSYLQPGSEIGGCELPVSRPCGSYRWWICALLFVATVVNYTDRQVLGILADTLQAEIGWSERDYGFVVAAFSTAYAIALLVWGTIIDRVGTRLGYSLAVTLWNLAAMAHALARTAFGFGVVRFGLGLSEAGNFPAAIKTVAEWFPRHERALAVGLFNAGSNVGAIVAPLLVPWLTLTWGWQSAFLVTGGMGFGWLVLWLWFYAPPEHHPHVSPAELAYIQQDPPETDVKVPWGVLFRHRQTWAFLLAKALTDPVWWFYLFWLPKYLKAEHGIDLKHVALPLIVVYLVADGGSIGGGWLSGQFLKCGWSVNRSRKLAMLVCALCVVPIITVPAMTGVWSAVLLVSLAAAAHQGWSANLFTTASDMFPKKVLASAVGIGGFAGAVGGIGFQAFTGWFLDHTHKWYTPLFWLCGLAYLVALLAVHLLVPRLEPARLEIVDPRS
jgi:ACS family hexuronate transporter-like MFS transporter